MLTGEQVKRTRYAHQVSLAGLHLLMKESYGQSSFQGTLEEWIEEKIKESVQFRFWYTAMELQALVLMLIRSIRTSNSCKLLF